MPRINHLKKNILDGFKQLPEKVQVSVLKGYGEPNTHTEGERAQAIEDIIVKLESRPQRQFLENLINWSLNNILVLCPSPKHTSL